MPRRRSATRAISAAGAAMQSQIGRCGTCAAIAAATESATSSNAWREIGSRMRKQRQRAKTCMALHRADTGTERAARNAKNVIALRRVGSEHPRGQPPDARFMIEAVQRRVIEHERIVAPMLGIANEQRIVPR